MNGSGLTWGVILFLVLGVLSLFFGIRFTFAKVTLEKKKLDRKMVIPYFSGYNRILGVLLILSGSVYLICVAGVLIGLIIVAFK